MTVNAIRHQEAIDWLVRVREAPADAAVQREFDQWLAQGDRHRLAYLDALIAMNAAAEPVEPLSAPAFVPVQTRRWAAPLTGFVFGALALVAVAIGPRTYVQLSADEVSPPGQSRALTLADGSQLVLGPDSAIEVALGDDGRRIELLRGSVQVDVAADPRPLAVHYQDYEIRDIGTRFVVHGADDLLRVAVASGRVDVRHRGGAAVELGAGEQGEWQADSSERWRYREPEAAAGMLVLDHAPATLALAQWSSMSGRRLVVMGSVDRAADARLDAVLPMRTDEEQQAALDTLARRFGLTVSADAVGVVVLRAGG